MRTDFEYWVPIEKSGVSIDPETGDVLIDGPISTERRDLQGERVLAEAVESGLDTFARLGMPIDWNHLSVKQPSAKDFDTYGAPVRFQFGEGVKVHDGPAPGGGTTKYLQGRLYKSKKATQDCLEHINAGGKLYYSIGGEAERNSAGTVKRTNITHVAVTNYPANPDCLIGFSALAKSMGVTDASDAPVRDADPSQFADDLRETNRLLAGIAKTLSAGAGAGLSSTGGRALIGEDLEGAPRDCKCKGECTCHQEASTGDDSPPDNDRGPARAGHKGKTTMGKNAVLDEATSEGLDALETDPKLGPIAKAMKGVVDFVASLGKSGKMAGCDSDDDSDDDDSDDDGGGAEDDDDGGKQLGKGIDFSSDSLVADVDLAQFNSELLKAMDVRYARLEKRLCAHIDKQVAAQTTEIKKSLDSEDSASRELLKTFDQLGMRPRPTGAALAGAQGAEPGKTMRNKNETRRLLEKAYASNLVTEMAMPRFEMFGELPDGWESLSKSL